MGKRIRRVRERKKISRKDLAEYAGLAPSTIADLENGYQKSTTKLHKVAELLGVSETYLEDGGPERPQRSREEVTAREHALLEAFRSAHPAAKEIIERAAGVPPITPPDSISQKRRSA
jgi:transcriptional regulator with XRE-family HTH domain